MKSKKYELTDTTKPHPFQAGVVLHQIRALRDIPRFGVKAGDVGGWIEKEANLAQDGDSWVYGDARVYGDAQVSMPGHILTIGPVGSENKPFTIYRTADGHQCVVGCWGPGTLDELEAEVKCRKTDEWAHRPKAARGLWKAQYKHAITLGRVMAKSWHDH